MDPRCTAKAKSTGKPCARRPIPGARVCRFHGGGAPQVKAAAAVRALDGEIRATLARLDVDPIADPLSELAQIAGEVVAWKNAIAAKVNELTSIRYEGVGSGEQLRAEIALFERALDRCASVLGLIAKLGIDERMARISERQADLVIGAVNAALADAGLTGEQAQQARQVAARHLRAVS